MEGINRLDAIIEGRRAELTKISDQIWAYAETRFEEKRSAELLCTALEQEDFTVRRGVAGIPTAFIAEYGKGGPVVAILGEYDALSGLSQKSGQAVKEALVDNGTGHGCGHHLLGTGALAGALAVKQYMAETGVGGTIRYYGCPGEEGGSGKTFMAREGVFAGVDVALTWHPLTHHAVMSLRTLANFQVYFKFHGRSAHAAATPHLGRSALDAVELMNVGGNYLREHIIPEARMHYAVTGTGGRSPNVVQAEAEVLYLIRAPRIAQVKEIYARVCDIARGAALMTGTECEIVFDKACSDYLPNQALEQMVYRQFQEVGIPLPDEQDRKFARAIRDTLTQADIDSDLHTAAGMAGGLDAACLRQLKQEEVSSVLLPYSFSPMLLPGSTDVGDVSWIVPTAQFSVGCYAFGTPGHSWQNVAQGKMPLAHAGMMTAGKILARSAVKLLIDTDLIAAAKAELAERLDGGEYVCPIPPGVNWSVAK